MRIVFMGTPEFAVYPLECLVADAHQVIAVYTQPDKAAGRGRNLTESPVKKAASKLNLNILQPVSLKSTEAITQLIELKPDVIVIAAFGQILPQSVLEIPPFRCVNIHPSLLPKYRGVAPVPAAIINGDEFVGVSIMLVEHRVDTGPLLARAQIPILSHDTTDSLMEKLSHVGAQLLLDILPRWVHKEIKPQLQSDVGATYIHMLKKEEGEINWTLPSVDIWRRVRAYQPWPGCYTRWQGKQLKILEAVPVVGGETAETGKVVVVDKKQAVFGVVTGNGILGIIKVQLEGKRVMTAEEFLRGQRQFIGAVLS